MRNYGFIEVFRRIAGFGSRFALGSRANFVSRAKLGSRANLGRYLRFGSSPLSRSILCLLLLLLSFSSSWSRQANLGTGGSLDRNHVVHTVYRQAFTSPPSNPTTDQAMRDIEYYDGLGRLIQQVEVRGSGGSAYWDVVRPVVYDAFGRVAQEYLPYATATGAGGAFKTNATSAQSTFYASTPPTGQSATGFASSQRVYEQSPLQRVQQQGFAGSVWQWSCYL